MPELPEVETVRRGLASRLVSRRITRFQARSRKLRSAIPRRLGERIIGRRVTEVARRGKYLIVLLDDGGALIMHLGMSGRILLSPAPPPWGRHDHVVIGTDDGTFLRLNDARRFGLMAYARADRLAGHPLLAGLGPEPVEPDFDGRVLRRLLAGRRTAIKTALLDQRLIAGLGNIYACEALFRAGISPRSRAGSLSRPRAQRLAAAIKTVLGEAIAAGGATLRDHRRPDGEIGYFQHQFAVYGREGEACPGCDCDPVRTGGIRRIVQGGRATFFCPRRQR